MSVTRYSTWFVGMTSGVTERCSLESFGHPLFSDFDRVLLELHKMGMREC
jgi:hypothetical protein